MQSANQTLNRLRHPNVLPFSASWRCYPGNLGLRVFRPNGMLGRASLTKTKDAAQGPGDQADFRETSRLIQA
jgi:hypothetical protein